LEIYAEKNGNGLNGEALSEKKLDRHVAGARKDH
jgi:hypothetical protein